MILYRTRVFKQVIRHPWISVICLSVCLYAIIELIRSKRLGLPSFLLSYADIYEELDIVSRIALNLDIHIDPPDNFRFDGEEQAVILNITFTNKGHTTIAFDKWAIFFNSFHPTKPETLACGLAVRHVNGNLYFLMPSEDLFFGIKPGASLLCQFHIVYSVIARTDFLPNWYVTYLDDRKGLKTIASTEDDSLSFVGNFDAPNKWKNSPMDHFNPYTAGERYRMNHISDTTATRAVLPTPRSWKRKQDEDLSFDTRRWRLLPSKDFRKEVLYLSDTLRIIVSTSTDIPKKNYIQLKQSDDIRDDEGYHLEVNSADESVRITAKSSAGAFYGVQTLRSILAMDPSIIPIVEIKDSPRFPYRGVMIDVARNFQSKESILKFIDVMSTYKLNKLHLHLSDDEGWRLEIPGLPELTKIGAKRCHPQPQRECLIPSLGSGPYMNYPGSGFYTAADYRQILKYASDRHVQIIPEFDMPGHSRAAIQSMQKRAERKGMSQKDTYILSDDDMSAQSVQNWLGNAMNPCLNSTYRFVETILDTLIMFHRKVQDLKVFHFGGDEVAQGAWDSSLACQNLIGQNRQINSETLKKLFVHTVAGIAHRKGLGLVAWEDGMYTEGVGPFPRNEFKNKEMYIIPWSNVWERGTGGRAIEFADADYKVILAMATHLYFDHPYEPDPEERGLHWATRYTDTKKAFGFMPEDIFANADVSMFGIPYNISQLCNNEICPKTKRPQNVIGLQACLWSETIRSATHLQNMAFPRLLAVAERAWHKASWEYVENREERKSFRQRDWKTFAKTLGYKELPRLEKMGVHYRVAPPGVILDGDTIRVNALYPGHYVEISTDGRTWPIIQNDENPIYIKYSSHKNIYIRTVSSVLRRTSRIVHIAATSSAHLLRYSSVYLILLYFIQTLFC